MIRLPTRKKLLAGCAAALGLPALFLLEENARGLIQLKRERQRIIAAGGELSIRELTPVLSAEETANAMALDEAGKELKSVFRQCPLVSDAPTFLDFTESGEARVLFRVAEPQFSILPAAQKPRVRTWEELERQVALAAEPLAAVKTLLKKPLAYAIDYEKIVVAVHLASGPHDAQLWLHAELLLHLHAKNFSGATETLTAIIVAPRTLEKTQTLIAQAIRIGFAAYSSHAAWAALQADGWTEEQLAALQARLRSPELSSFAGQRPGNGTGHAGEFLPHAPRFRSRPCCRLAGESCEPEQIAPRRRLPGTGAVRNRHLAARGTLAGRMAISG